MKEFYAKHKKAVLLIGGTILVALVVTIVFKGDTSAIRTN